VHDKVDRKDSKRTLSLMDLLNWDHCSDMAWLLLQSGRNDSQNKSGVGLRHDFEVVNEEALSAISIEMGCTSSEMRPRNK
jgi:hypothetical protein